MDSSYDPTMDARCSGDGGRNDGCGGGGGGES
jgi:hypothetical protein